MILPASSEPNKAHAMIGCATIASNGPHCCVGAGMGLGGLGGT